MGSSKFLNLFDPIKEGLLSTRALNCCRNIGVENISQLIEYAESDGLYSIRNCGPKTILELQDVIRRYGFGQEQDIIPSYLSSSVEKIFDDTVLSCAEDVQTYFLNVFPNAKSLYSQCFLTYSSIFIDLPNTEPIETVFECWQLGYEIINKTSQLIIQNRIYRSGVHKNGTFEDNLLKCLHSINKHFVNAKAELIFSRLSVPLTEVLNNKFQQIKVQLPTRAQNVLEREQITAKTIIQFCRKLESSRNIRSCGEQTASDIIIAYDSFYKFIVQLANSSPAQCNELVVRNKYPFLEDKESDDIIQFQKELGHLPFFRLTYLYFLKSKDRRDVVYNKANGITESPQAMAEIAHELGLSRERVRQIISHYLPPPQLYDIMPLLSNQFYPFLTMDFVDPSEVYHIISNAEFAHPNEFTEDALIGMLLLSKRFKPLIYGGKTLILSTETFNSFDFGSAIKDIANMALSKTVENIALPVSIFINNYILSNSFDCQKIEHILSYIANRVLGVEIDHNNNIILKQNAVDVEDEFYKILDSVGSPLSFDELCAKLLELHPTISYAPGTLRSFLSNSDRISAIGKTSTFTLKKWNISHLTIRGLIHQILKECDTPLSLDDIVDFLAIKGRKTNKNSVNSNILLDEKYDFVKFEGGLIGIKSKNYGTSYVPIDRSSMSRKSFEERITDFLNYIDTNHHIPFASSDEVEASLNRWYKNVIKGILDVTEEQKKLLETELSKRKEFIMTSSEFAFIEKCKDMKYFVSSKFELPTIRTDAQLYNWFSKTRQKSFQFTPQKEKAYKDLVQFLSDYGFCIED